jgi:D-proline reductase (dithiol) PrdB
VTAIRPLDAVPYIERTRRLYARQAPYRWVENHRDSAPPPWAPLRVPIARARVALIASGGVHRADQPPFHFREDTSWREIPFDTPLADLRVAHFGYDVRDARRDPGCVFPTAALRALAAEGAIGSLADPALSFMGGIYSSRRVRDEIAPRMRDFVLRQQADLAYLVPA